MQSNGSVHMHEKESVCVWSIVSIVINWPGNSSTSGGNRLPRLRSCRELCMAVDQMLGGHHNNTEILVGSIECSPLMSGLKSGLNLLT